MSLRYSSAETVLCGLPLGGFGCGVLQVFPDGTRGMFTGLNNWEKPLQQLHWFRHGTADDFRQANPFGLFVAWDNHRVAKLLQRAPVAHCPVVQDIVLEADFPIAKLSFRDHDIPIDVSFLHFSPFIPHDAKHSSLPVVISLARLSNPLDRPVTVGLLACCINVIGSWNVGRYNRLIRQPGLLGLRCLRRQGHARDEKVGSLALATETSPKKGASDEVTYFTTWMYAAEPFRGNIEDRRLEAWRYFAQDGRLPNDATSTEAMGECDEPMGAVAVRLRLEPGQTREVPFLYAWYTPNHLYGHRYQRWFTSAWDVIRYASSRRTRLLAQTEAWHATIRDSGLPEWLADGLINSLTVYTAASWWTRDGRFTVYENPIKWPLMDSLDVRYYGTLPLACWFPAFEQSTMLQFAKAQRRDGRIPHDLGKAQLECPSDGTTAGRPWKDLAPKFALMAYRDVLWSGDRRFLHRIYPHVKRAMQWERTTDRNGDGLPDNEGRDSTYDLWAFYGTSSYTSSIVLASLLALEQLARMMHDGESARWARAWFRQAQRSFEEKLWAGSYYLAARHDDGTAYEPCIVGQLNGQWYAHLLQLGHLVAGERIRKAVHTMLALNGQASAFGAVNSVYPDGTIDTSSSHARNIWVGETYALASLAIYEGFVDDALELVRKTWLTFVEHAKSPWSQPDIIEAEDGRLGDGEFYIRNIAIWGVPFALASRQPRIRQMLQTLAPQLPLGPMKHQGKRQNAKGKTTIQKSKF